MVGSIADLLSSTRPDFSKLPGGWEPNERTVPELSLAVNAIAERLPPNLEGRMLHQVISSEDCQNLIWLMKQSPNTEGVSVQGRKDVPDYRMGSVRTTIWSPKLAMQLWRKMGHLIPNRTMNQVSATDWWQGDKNRLAWRAVGLSPLLRFMRYDRGGQHYAHYDAGFIYPDDNIRTLQSVVFYLTTTEIGGATRFIRDDQQLLPIWDRNHQDWVREATADEVLFRSQPEQGKALIFDHRLCHDVETYQDTKPRVIIRADIVFKAGE